MTSPQFIRYFDIRIGQPGQEGKKWFGDSGNVMTVSFEVERKGARSNAKLRLKMTNLSVAEVGFIEQEGNVVSLIAGYRASNGLIFSGTISRKGVETTLEGTDRVTSIEAGEKESELQKARISKSYDAGTSIKTVLSGIADTIGVGIANINDIEGSNQTFSTGFTYFGRSRGALDEVTSQLGPEFDWILEDGQIWILNGDKTMSQQAVLLKDKDGENTGLVGAPQRQKKGLAAKCLLRPQLRPGRLVKVESDEFDGFYKISQATHSGDTSSNDWYTSINCREIK